MAQSTVKFTTFQWNGILKRLLQMFITRVACSEQLDWSVGVGSPRVAQGFHGERNRSAGTHLCLRGLYAAQVDVSCLAAPELYPSWLPDPLLVSASSTPFQGYEMSCTLLSADQVCATLPTWTAHWSRQTTCWAHVTLAHARVQSCVGPVKLAAAKATTMLHASAFVHQYQKWGIDKEYLQGAVQHAQDVVAAYEVM